MGSKLKIALDMDGVIADFTCGLCSVNNIPFDANDYKFPFGLWDYSSYLESTFGLEWSSVVQQCTWSFWAGLSLMPDAMGIYGILTSMYDVFFLTTATGSLDAVRMGKLAWLYRHGFITSRGEEDRLVVATDDQSKGDFACGDVILVDDKDINVQEFIKAGGHGVVVPRPWNNRHFEFRNYKQANLLTGRNVISTVERICT
jgi:5'(3')-deoxyribonucleotidase